MGSPLSKDSKRSDVHEASKRFKTSARRKRACHFRLDSYVFHNFEVGFQLMGSRENPTYLVLFILCFSVLGLFFASSWDLPF